MKLNVIADRLHAQLEGDGDLEIVGVAGIGEAGPSDLTFLANPRYRSHLRTTAAGAILLSPEIRAQGKAAVLRAANPYLAFARAIDLFYTPPAYPPGVHSTAVIDESARLGEGAHVGPYAVVGADVIIGLGAVLLAHSVIYPGATIGDHFFAHAHAVVREHCRLGDDVTLQNGAIVGSDGFGYAKDEAQRWSKIVQSGTVVLGSGVEVQANSCVDRASVGTTRVGDGTKIDNLVQVGHGSAVGEDTLLCAQVGLAGSSTLGDRVVLAGQVGVAGHCRIGDDVVATAQSGIPGDVASRSVVSGYPAMDNRQWLRAVAAFARMPEVLRELRAQRRGENPNGAS